MCSACGDIERRLVFRHVGQHHGEPVPVHTAPPISPALPVPLRASSGARPQNYAVGRPNDKALG
jgi:hypothetical protein